MATELYDTVTLKLQDGSEVVCRPLKIKYLRQFMKAFAKMTNEVRNDSEQAIDVLFECAVVAFAQFRPDIKPEDLEELLDLPTLYKAIEVGSGIKMTGDDEGND